MSLVGLSPSAGLGWAGPLWPCRMTTASTCNSLNRRRLKHRELFLTLVVKSRGLAFREPSVTSSCSQNFLGLGPTASTVARRMLLAAPHLCAAFFSQVLRLLPTGRQAAVAISVQEGAPQASPGPCSRAAAQGEGQGGQQAERCRPSQLSCQTALPRRSQTSGTGLTNYPSAPSAVWGSCEGECM